MIAQNRAIFLHCIAMPTNEPTLTDAEIQRFLEKPQGITSHELLLIATHGLTLEEAREAVAERDRVNAKARKLVNKPVKDWPEFEVK